MRSELEERLRRAVRFFPFALRDVERGPRKTRDFTEREEVVAPVGSHLFGETRGGAKALDFSVVCGFSGLPSWDSGPANDDHA